MRAASISSRPMKKLLLLSALLLAAGIAMAQNRVIDLHPAHDGDLVSMEQAVGRTLYPERVAYRWVDNDSYLRWAGNAYHFYFLDGTERLSFPEMQRPLAVVDGPSLLLDYGTDSTWVAVSTDPGISYGQSVSRNEFGIDKGTFFSPSRRKLAFYRKDESRVTDFPLLDIETRTGTLRSIKYPMNGMESERISIGVYDLESGRTVYLQVTDFQEDRYLTNLSWSPDERFLFVQVVDRAQHHMHLNQYDAATGAFVQTLLTEENPAWIEPLDPIWFVRGREDLFIYRTDNRDGYRNLYLVSTKGEIRRLTCVDADVAYVGNDGKWVYYTSAEVSPVENHLYRIDISKKKKFGKPVALTPERGWHEIAMNEACTAFIDQYSSLNNPGRNLLRKADGSVIRVLDQLEDRLAGYASCQVELGTVPSADGQFENYYRLIYPKDFDPSKKYPVILYVYGGPHSQMVRDSWLAEIRMWEMLMAQRGYLVYVQDNRGTENRGAAFEKAINRRCGQEEMADQMVGIRRLCSLPYVDATRIGVHGWSYGGFMTISLMTTYPDVFKVGVAGGPVIDWQWYEIMYGERYMDTMHSNPEGFALTSLVDKAPQLKGRLLICQGAVDNTVVWQHSLNFVQSCIDNGNALLDYFPYPTAEHNVFGPNRVQLMDKVTLYFQDYL